MIKRSSITNITSWLKDEIAQLLINKDVKQNCANFILKNITTVKVGQFLIHPSKDLYKSILYLLFMEGQNKDVFFVLLNIFSSLLMASLHLVCAPSPGNSQIFITILYVNPWTFIETEICSQGMARWPLSAGVCKCRRLVLRTGASDWPRVKKIELFTQSSFQWMVSRKCGWPGRSLERPIFWCGVGFYLAPTF